jgi:hypothetical protein
MGGPSVGPKPTSPGRPHRWMATGADLVGVTESRLQAGSPSPVRRDHRSVTITGPAGSAVDDHRRSRVGVWDNQGTVSASVRDWLGLLLSFVSALVVSWAYSREHAAAVTLPPVSVRHPIASARTLVSDRQWMIGFGAEGGGWVVYLFALRLAPLALVQAVNASGVAVLAFLSTGGHLGNLRRRERVAVACALSGLVLLAVSLIGTTPSEAAPRPVLTAIWLAASLTGAALFAAKWPRALRASTLGAAAGVLFAGGDTSAKLLVRGGGWALAAIPLILFYSLGSIQLQSAFQHGNVLVAAGTANLATNAIPIAAGFVLFHEALPQGAGLGIQIAAFAAILIGAMLLGDRARGSPQREQAPTPAVQHCG